MSFSLIKAILSSRDYHRLKNVAFDGREPRWTTRRHNVSGRSNVNKSNEQTGQPFRRICSSTEETNSITEWPYLAVSLWLYQRVVSVSWGIRSTPTVCRDRCSRTTGRVTRATISPPQRDCLAVANTRRSGGTSCRPVTWTCATWSVSGRPISANIGTSYGHLEQTRSQ